MARYDGPSIDDVTRRTCSGLEKPVCFEIENLGFSGFSGFTGFSHGFLWVYWVFGFVKTRVFSMISIQYSIATGAPLFALCRSVSLKCSGSETCQLQRAGATRQ